jgi:hypothetical protein
MTSKRRSKRLKKNSPCSAAKLSEPDMREPDIAGSICSNFPVSHSSHEEIHFAGVEIKSDPLGLAFYFFGEFLIADVAKKSALSLPLSPV